MTCSRLLGLPPTWRCTMPHGHAGECFRLVKWEAATRGENPLPPINPPAVR